MVPKPVVVFIVIVVTLLLAADILGQFVIPGHTASPVIDGGLVALLGATVTGAKGPRPEEPSTPPPSTAPLPTAETPGRHHRGED